MYVTYPSDMEETRSDDADPESVAAAEEVAVLGGAGVMSPKQRINVEL